MDFHVKIERLPLGMYRTNFYWKTDLRESSTGTDIPIVQIVQWLLANDK